MRQYALDVQLCMCIDQLAVLHVNQKCEMSQKISTEDGLPNISNDENPRECSLRPRSSVRERLPYVRIGVLFTAVRVSVSEACRSVPWRLLIETRSCIHELPLN